VSLSVCVRTVRAQGCEMPAGTFSRINLVLQNAAATKRDYAGGYYVRAVVDVLHVIVDCWPCVRRRSGWRLRFHINIRTCVYVHMHVGGKQDTERKMRVEQGRGSSSLLSPLAAAAHRVANTALRTYTC